MSEVFRYIRDIDWILTIAVVIIATLGLVTMHSFAGEAHFFERQLILVLFSLAVFFLFSCLDFRFLRRTGVVVALFFGIAAALMLLLGIGVTLQGAQRWLDLGLFTLQISEFAKIALIILLAKYFTKRHIEIGDFRHIFVSGAYAAVFFALVFFQPDFGSSVIIGLIWLGMIMAAGISLRHLGVLFLLGAIAFTGLWSFGLEDYQRDRVTAFLQPYAELEEGGYHTRQSTIAVGSGELLGKGVGYGTQSSLQFLPEHETDFIFAAFAEEWGFLGVIFLFTLFGVVIWRILANAGRGETNFEVLFGVGLAILLISHIAIHVGANMGLLPVTGTTLPFMSFGGSHLLALFMALGILMGMRRYRRIFGRRQAEHEVEAI